MTTIEQHIEEMQRRHAEELASFPDTWICPSHGAYPSMLQDDSVARPQRECPACAAALREALEAWKHDHWAWRAWNSAGVPRRFKNRSLDNWQQRSVADRKLLAAVRAWIEGLEGSDVLALVLSGGIGLGKTHLLTGLIVAAIREGITARYVAVPDLLGKLRESYRRDSDGGPEALLEPLERTKLLVLDEVGASKGSRWEQETLSALVDARYREERPVVIATNAAPDELPQYIGERAADRISEFGVVLTLQGASYRSKAPSNQVLREALPVIEEPSYKLRFRTTHMGVPRDRLFSWDGHSHGYLAGYLIDSRSAPWSEIQGSSSARDR